MSVTLHIANSAIFLARVSIPKGNVCIDTRILKPKGLSLEKIELKLQGKSAWSN